jgi:hypothetical protein
MRHLPGRDNFKWPAAAMQILTVQNGCRYHTTATTTATHPAIRKQKPKAVSLPCMADVHSKETRSYNMSRIRSNDTKPEMLVRKFLHKNGLLDCCINS